MGATIENSAQSDKDNLRVVLKKAEYLLNRSPNDIAAHYSLGIAYIIANDYINGFNHLLQIIKIYNQLSSNSVSFEVKSFVGLSALQLAELADFCQPLCNRLKECFYAADQGATLAAKIGLEIGDNPMVSKAQSIMARLFSKRDKGLMEGYLKPKSPPVLQVEPTNYCNLRCRMCPYPLMKRQKGYMTEKLFDDILSSWSGKLTRLNIVNLVSKQPVNMDRQGVLKLFFMGEPLLHPDIIELIKKAGNAGCMVGLQTNGLLLRNKELQRGLLNAAPAEIGLSIDGIDSQTYDSIREGSSWTQICSNLKDLAALRAELGLTNTVRLSIASILTENTALNRQRADAFFEPVRSFVDDIHYLNLDCKYHGAFLDSEGLLSKYNDSEKIKDNPGNVKCQEPLGKMNILWDGSLTPCCNDIEGNIILGHVKDGIDSVWNNAKTYSLQKALILQNLDEFSFCKSCISGNLMNV